MAASPLLLALSPAHSAVVEACAGSGKTWLLVSRMLRLMLAGAEPSELLAITFTRKAAEEMRSRLDAWLQDLALLPESDAFDFLVQRGMDRAEARAALPRARNLLEAVLTARPGPLITTFHGWFFHLLDHAPLSRRVPGELVEHAALLREEAWFEFTDTLGRRPDSPQTHAFSELAGHLSLPSLRKLLETLLDRRAEWWAYGADPARAVEGLESCLGLTEGASPLAEFFSLPGLGQDFREYGQLLGQEARKLKTEAKRALSLETALAAWEAAPEACFDHLYACLLTEKGEPRALKVTAAMEGRLGMGPAQRYVMLHQQLADQLVTTANRLAEQRALRLNRLGLTAGQAYLEAYQRLKREQGALDFTDAELEVARLLEDETAAAAVFMKLDTRWKHLLLDEFQDTTPLQWRILRSWLEAYGQDGVRPTVFLVGDPKQSIYRFRRAEPRLFRKAGDWLARHYGAVHYPQNETRRCAPRVVAWVNAVFANRPDYLGFVAHTAHQDGLPGWCELFAAPAADLDLSPPAFRLPLVTPPSSPPPRRAREAEWVAGRIRDIVGRLWIQDTPPRPACFGDITLLYAKRAEIQVFEDAFKAAGIPFITDRRGELLATLEARDLTALLTWLVDPRDDLALAHVLKSPVFSLSDEDLLDLAATGDGDWWARLTERAGRPEAAPGLCRAFRLLEAWRALAGTLPIHDLLDRIFHEGEVSARYAQSVPDSMLAGVLANLDGFLALSLSLSGGRYPSLPRFLDELRRLRDKAGQEGPDEPPAAAGDRVRMLTIHSAKGLESPVVFLIKADAGEGRDDAYGVLQDWPPGADHPTHFSLYGPREWRGPGRDALFRQEREQAAVERLNLLYVAMTRARQALFVSGITPRDGKADTAGWLGCLAAGLEKAGMAGLPEMTWQDRADSAPGSAPAPRPGPATMAWPGVGTRRPAETPQAAFGTLLHAWMEHRTEGMDEDAIAALLDLDEQQAATLADSASRILALPELAPAYDPARHLRALNELEYLDAAGRSARMDRLVEFNDEVWVLDYKSGGLDEPNPQRRAQPHLEQMAGYQRAAQTLFPHKRIRGALVFTDGVVHWL